MNLNDRELYERLSDNNKMFFDTVRSGIIYYYQRIYLLLALLESQEEKEVNC